MFIRNVGAILPDYVGVLVSLGLFLFSYLQHNKIIFLGWVKEVRTTKS
jgi:hypothetical protein